MNNRPLFSTVLYPKIHSSSYFAISGIFQNNLFVLHDPPIFQFCFRFWFSCIDFQSVNISNSHYHFVFNAFCFFEMHLQYIVVLDCLTWFWFDSENSELLFNADFTTYGAWSLVHLKCWYICRGLSLLNELNAIICPSR